MATEVMSSFKQAKETIPPPSSKKDHVAIGKAATMELWDMIRAPRNRFTEAQMNRMFCHPCLEQPSPEEERQHLSNRSKTEATKKNLGDMNERSSGSITETKLESDLHARLAAALGHTRISPASSNSSLYDDNDFDDFTQSPTSTLNFPGDNMIGMPLSKSNHDLSSSTYEPTCDDCAQQIVPKKRKKGSEINRHLKRYDFVVCADTQIGMTSQNDEWETELEYSRHAVNYINSMRPKPAFVSVCGDLVDMEYTFYNYPDSKFTKEQCDDIQDKQNRDWQRVWSQLDDDIPLLCLCGNHDIGNRPTKASIDRFKSAFGDDYLAFWTNGSYNIILNSCLFSDPSGAPEEYAEQLHWLEERLRYARAHEADHIFIFSHHPWFLYDENESRNDLKGIIPFPKEWGGDGDKQKGFSDSHFPIDLPYRKIALRLFKEYGVSACFSGHFHQNLLSKTSWGMDMIITAPLSIVFESSPKPKQIEENGRGARVVTVDKKKFTHRFECLF